MARKDYVNYIQSQLEDKPLAYQLGFLQAQLAEAMYNDSRVFSQFKHTVNKRFGPNNNDNNNNNKRSR